MNFCIRRFTKSIPTNILVFSVCYSCITHGETLKESAKLFAQKQTQGDLFGFNVVADNSRVLVGALKQDSTHAADTGAAFLYQLKNDRWQPEVLSMPRDLKANDGFGGKLAIRDNVVAVGAIGDDDVTEDGGIVYLYQYLDGKWQESLRIYAPDSQPGDAFGQSIGMSANTLVIGAPKSDDKGKDSGSAYVFAKTENNWIFSQKLTAPDGAAGDVFGISSAISGDTILIGADLNDEKANNAGAAYVYVKRGKQWELQSKLMASDAGDTDIFGVRVALDGNTALISARRDDDEIVGKDSGSAYLFRRKGHDWYQEAKLTGPTQQADDRFGRSVALSGDTALIGAMHKDYTGQNAGAAYLYKRNDGNWNLVKTLTASDSNDGDQLGWSVALSQNHAIVSAAKHAVKDNDAGAVYVFNLPKD